MRVDVSQGDRVRSRVLKAWLRAVGSGDAVRIRIAEGEHGEILFPTEAEAERTAKEAERAAKEAERAAREAAEAAKEAAEAAKEAAEAATEVAEAAKEVAEAEVARLRLLLERAKRSGR